MRATSLRSRLWLSYALLGGVVLCVVGAGFALSLQSNPFLYRQTVARLRLAEALLDQRLQQPQVRVERLERFLRSEAAGANGLRYVLLDVDGSVLVDSSDAKTGFPSVPLVAQKDSNELTSVLTVRDAQGNVWLYLVHALPDGRWLLIAAPRPRLTLRMLVRDELIAPVLRAGAVAVLLAFVLAFFMERWIAAPLQRMSTAARTLAAGRYASIPLEGPGEVQDLAQSFNEMGQRLQASQQSQRDFVANVSHELKTPLTSIQGFAQAILDDAVQTPEELRRAAGVIHDEAGRMYRLVLDLLTLTRLEGGTADLRREPVDLQAVLQHLVEKFAPQARQANVSLRLEMSAACWLIGDGDRLAQVFTNLVDNAIKFTPPGGQVVVRGAVNQGMVVVQVADSGAGISAADQQRIFERFYQVDRARRGGSGRGAGLGLPIAMQIVLAHAGEIQVQSQPGQGSLFSVRLPLAQPQDETLNQKKNGA